MTAIHIIGLAETDIGGIVGVIVFLLYGLVWLLKRIAESKGQRIQLTKKHAAQEEESEDYAADEKEVQEFLKNLGIGTAAKPKSPGAYPTRPPAAQPMRKPIRPPHAAARPVQTLQSSPPPLRRPMPKQPTPGPDEEYVFGAGRVQATSTSVEKPKRRRIVSDTAPTTTTRASRTAMSIEERLAFPNLSSLQRAVVLSEILPRKRGPHRSRK